MSIDELYTLCVEAVQQAAEHPEWSHGEVLIIVPTPWKQQARIKLFRTKGAPFGKPVQELPNGTVVRYEAQAILDFLDREAMIGE